MISKTFIVLTFAVIASFILVQDLDAASCADLTPLNLGNIGDTLLILVTLANITNLAETSLSTISKLKGSTVSVLSVTAAQTANITTINNGFKNVFSSQLDSILASTIPNLLSSLKLNISTSNIPTAFLQLTVGEFFSCIVAAAASISQR